jgi:hypothetical protein
MGLALQAKVPNSELHLCLTALHKAKGDVDKAQKIVEYFTPGNPNYFTPAFADLIASTTTRHRR